MTPFPPGLQTLSEHGCHGGVQGFYRHDATSTGTPMQFGVYRPPQAALGPVPMVFCLAGLTCTEETFAIKAGAQARAARLGLMLVTPDTSPRNTGIAEADAHWDFGTSAGFYLDASQDPWRRHWRMEHWIVDELLTLLLDCFPARPERIGVLGHSMGGHGALTLALRHPIVFRSCSAFAPIAAPMQCPWGVKAFTNYLGADTAAWREHDACALLADGRRAPALLVDQGLSDPFLAEGQLRPDLLEAACQAAGQPLTLRRHAGYDHGYWFIQSFIEEHLAHHARALA
jgi:S-formylglutathione hydrolase